MEYFTVAEFAEKMKICKHSVRRAIKQGHIHAIRPALGKKSCYRIPESELERLLIASMCKENK